MDFTPLKFVFIWNYKNENSVRFQNEINFELNLKGKIVCILKMKLIFHLES